MTDDIDELLADRPSDRFDHHTERLEGRDIMTKRQKRRQLDPKPPIEFPGFVRYMHNLYEHEAVGEDYKALFGWFAGVVSVEEMLKHNPDLSGIVQ